MGLRFRKSVKIAPGVRVNLSKSGVSTTTKLGGGFSWRTQVIGGKRGNSGPRGPVPLRWWYILIAVVFALGIFGTTASIAARIVSLCIGLAMLAVTVATIVRANKKSRPE